MYPIKGCRGFSVESALLTPRGLEHDRCFVVVKADSGKFISMRSHPKMCMIKTSISLNMLVISLYHPAKSSDILDNNTSSSSSSSSSSIIFLPADIPASVSVPVHAEEYITNNAKAVSVSVWGKECAGYDCGDHAARWLSAALEPSDNGGDMHMQYPLRLVRMAPLNEFERKAELGGTVSFADQVSMFMHVFCCVCHHFALCFV